MFGDNLYLVADIPGDSFRHRHDKLRTVLNRFCLASNIRAECNVFVALRALIYVQALEQEEDGSRQTTFQLTELNLVVAATEGAILGGYPVPGGKGVER